MLLTYEEFMIDNEDWIQGREELGLEAYKNYCDTTTRYAEYESDIQELIQELFKARDNNIPVAYVMSIYESNFNYVGNDINLNTVNFVEATNSLNFQTISGNDMTIPKDMNIEKHEGIEAFTNSIEYIVRCDTFSIGFVFYYE